MEDGREIEILVEDDIVTARSAGREIARGIGFGIVDCTLVATAISELTRNIILYAGQGAITINILRTRDTPHDADSPRGLEIIATDTGPGIEDINLVMRDGYSTSEGMGLGLPGTRRLMDEFELHSEPGKGTTIRTTKWLVG